MLSKVARKAIREEQESACKWNCCGQGQSSKEVFIRIEADVLSCIARKAIREEREYCAKGIVADRVSPVRSQQRRRKSPLFCTRMCLCRVGHGRPRAALPRCTHPAKIVEGREQRAKAPDTIYIGREGREQRAKVYPTKQK